MRTDIRDIKNICIANYTGVLFHVGCQSVSYVLEDELKKRFGDDLNIKYLFSTTQTIGGEIPFTEDDFHVVLDNLNENHHLLNRLKEADLLILNGEGTLHWPTNNNRVWYWLACIYLAKKKFGIPVWVINSSFFSEDPVFTSFATKMFREADYIALRDPQSHEEVRKLGIDTAVSAADLTFLLPHAVDEDIAQYFRTKHPLWSRDDRGKRVVVAGSSALSGASLSRWTDAYRTLLGGLKERFPDIRVLFVAQPDMGGDVDLFSALQSEFEDMVCVRDSITPAEFIWQLGQADVVVSGRFHVNTIAIVSGTSAIMLSGNTPKNKLLVEMANVREYRFANIFDTDNLLTVSEEFLERSRGDVGRENHPREALRRLARGNFPTPLPPNVRERHTVDLAEFIRQTEFIGLTSYKKEMNRADEILVNNNKLNKRLVRKYSILDFVDNYTVGNTDYRDKYVIKLFHYLTHPKDGYARFKEIVRSRFSSLSLVPETPPPKKNKFHDATIKVLHVATTPLAGSPIRMCRLLDDGDYFSALPMCRKNAYEDGRSFDYDIVYEPLKANDSDHTYMRSLIEECDILHFHNEAYQYRFGVFADIPPHKPVCVQWHSGPDEIAHRLGLSIVDAMNYNAIPTLVVAQKQSRFYPHAIPVPNVVDIRLPEYQALERDDGVIRICYSPAGDAAPYEKLCRDKGMNSIISALHVIGKRYPKKVSIHILQGIPLDQCIQVKQKCHISIDDIKSGGYHMVSLEGFAHGSVTIANPDAAMKEFLSEYTGSPVDELPWFEASEENIVERLSELIEDVDAVYEIGKKSRAWMEKYWNHNFIMRKMQAAYTKIVEDS